MNFVDIIIILLALSAFARGREMGLVKQLLSTAGFLGGLFLGAYLERYTVRLAHTPLSRSVITLVTTLGCAIALLSLGEYIGIRLKHRLEHRSVDKVDGALGSVLGIITLLIAAWLGAAVLSALPLPSTQDALKSSAIISYLNRTLPSAPNVIGDLGRLVEPNGFPQVFAGTEPAPSSNAPLPDLGSLNAAISKDRGSVVKIEGLGCGGVVEGSGFVVGDDLVATNAHVVAGVRKPYAIDQNGQHTATPIWFDPNLDFAVLRVPNLAGDPLVLNTQNVARNSSAAVLGYPGGGPFSAGAAAVLDEFTATGRNIYGGGLTTRDVYELRAKVIPGNSGGPLVARDGSVIGVIFAESTTYNSVGYALSVPQIVSEISSAQARNQTVNTGRCAE